MAFPHDVRLKVELIFIPLPSLAASTSSVTFLARHPVLEVIFFSVFCEQTHWTAHPLLFRVHPGNRPPLGVRVLCTPNFFFKALQGSIEASVNFFTLPGDASCFCLFVCKFSLILFFCPKEYFFGSPLHLTLSKFVMISFPTPQLRLTDLSSLP